MSKPNRIGIYAASSIVPVAEFNLGVTILRENGFEVTVHPQVLKHHFMFPGSDEERAEALYELANDDRIDILWAARGGYGASRLLPILDQITQERGKPQRKKLLVGYSDVTVLHEFVRHHWGWSTLHASMPAGISFARLKPEEWNSTRACARAENTPFLWEQTQLQFIASPPSQPISGELVGGNLSLWQCVVGTPYAGKADGRILFLEDVDERPYRIDRMMVQIAQAGGFDNVRAIILGDFTSCDDESNTCLKHLAPGEDPRTILEETDKRERIPLRKTFTLDESLQEIFGPIGEKWKIPIAKGLPVGHGPNFSPLPLGASYTLSPQGKLAITKWDWIQAE
jgi:muramoyltetrapeptide carboxypeptidase